MGKKVQFVNKEMDSGKSNIRNKRIIAVKDAQVINYDHRTRRVFCVRRVCEADLKI